MKQNDKNLAILISRFAQAAKKVIGHVHTAQMSSDPGYATTVIVNIILVDHLALTEQAKDLAVDLNLNLDLIRAIEQYNQIILEQDLSADVIAEIQGLIKKLIPYIYHVALDGDIYRAAVDEYLATLEKSKVAVALEVVRGIYKFWCKEAGSIPHAERSSVFNYLSTLRTNNDNFFAEQWEQADQIELSEIESQYIHNYATFLDAQAVTKEAIITRRKLAKVILIAFRQHNHYRMAVNSLMQSIQQADVKQFFAEVSREFYQVVQNTITL